MSIPTLPHLQRGLPLGINHVPIPQHASPQRMASLLDKAARYAHTDVKGKATVGRGKQTQKGKRGAKVTKAVGRAIVGKSYSPGVKK